MYLSIQLKRPTTMIPNLNDYELFIEMQLEDAEVDSKEYNELEEDLASLRFYKNKLDNITNKYDPNQN